MAVKTGDQEFDWLQACPLCSGRQSRVWETAAGGYSVQPVRVRCCSCGLIYSNPQASEKRLKHFYEKIYFAQDEYKAGYFDESNAARERSKGAEELKILETDVSCRPCYKRHCPIDHRCMTRIEPEGVIRAACDALGFAA
jgi:hypothetical protein